MNLDDLLTLDECAAWLKMPRRRLLDLARAGRIPSCKLGRDRRFHPRTILEVNHDSRKQR